MKRDIWRAGHHPDCMGEKWIETSGEQATMSQTGWPIHGDKLRETCGEPGTTSQTGRQMKGEKWRETPERITMGQAGRQTTSEGPDTMGQTERHEFEYRGTNELEDIRRAGVLGGIRRAGESDTTSQTGKQMNWETSMFCKTGGRIGYRPESWAPLARLGDKRSERDPESRIKLSQLGDIRLSRHQPGSRTPAS